MLSHFEFLKIPALKFRDSSLGTYATGRSLAVVPSTLLFPIDTEAGSELPQPGWLEALGSSLAGEEPGNSIPSIP